MSPFIPYNDKYWPKKLILTTVYGYPFQIGTNGIIGIGERYNSLTIRDLSSSLTRRRRVLCPFWADLVGNTDMTEQGGKVYYRSYTK